MTVLFILLAGLIILELIWITTDPRPFQERIRKKTLFIYALSICFITPQVISALFFPIPPHEYEYAFVITGILFYITGVVISIWAKFEMGQVWGIPGQHDIKRQNKLITTGPFSFSRNPIYLGLLLISLGFALAVKSVFVFLVLGLYIFFNTETRKEEKLLEKHFGNEYLKYKKKVGRFI